MVEYEEAAQAYLRSLPLEHFMEAATQATQRKITLESLDLVAARRRDVQVFNELLVQYPWGRRDEIRQIVPDNMVVKSDEPVHATSSFNLPLESAPPFWVMEYVSKHNKRKDYGKSFKKYERELKVPYYLIFYPDNQELSLFHYNGRKYVSVKANEHGRYAVPEIEVEVALLDGWVRYWYQGKLVPLPADLQRDLEEAKRQTEEAKRQASQEKRRADRAEQRAAELEAEVVRLRAQIEQRRNGRSNGT